MQRLRCIDLPTGTASFARHLAQVELSCFGTEARSLYFGKETLSVPVHWQSSSG